MREILFRGKRIDNGAWVYGYQFKIWEQTYILWGTTNGVPNMIEVDPETVGQYAGLKDRQGKEMYEGDVILILLKQNKHTSWKPCVVEYLAPCYAFKVIENGDILYGLDASDLDDVEIIGDIYTTPELLG